MKTTIALALQSKKFIVFLSTWIVVLGNRALSHLAPGYELDSTEVQLYVGAAAAYIVGQGIADHGKEAAKIMANAGTAVVPPSGPVVIDKKPQAGFVRLGLMVVIAMLGAMLLFGCGGATARQTALMASMASLDATKAGLAAYDAKAEQQMLADATDKATLDATKAAYRAKVDKLVTDIATAADAIDKAWKADTDPSVAAAVAAVAAAGTLLVTIGVAK